MHPLQIVPGMDPICQYVCIQGSPSPLICCHYMDAQYVSHRHNPRIVLLLMIPHRYLVHQQGFLSPSDELFLLRHGPVVCAMWQSLWVFILTV